MKASAHGLAARLLIAAAFIGPGGAANAQGTPRVPVIVDLDIGDDIDDSFALAFVLASPEFDVRGITTAWGDTALRVRMVERLLREVGVVGVPVFEGIRTESKTGFSQARWASGPHATGATPAITATGSRPSPASSRSTDAGDTPAPNASHPTPNAAVEFLLAQARAHPGEITLLALGPLTNVGAAIRRDPKAFGQLKRVVMMGGSVHEGYRKSDYQPATAAVAEYNIVSDVVAAQALFASGVPIAMMPLDSTSLRLDDQKRAAIFSHGSTLTDALTLMYEQWTNANQPWVSATPTLFDVMPVAYVLQPAFCPTVPLHIDVDATGFTRETPGVPNADVCLSGNKPAVFERLMKALLR